MIDFSLGGTLIPKMPTPEELIIKQLDAICPGIELAVPRFDGPGLTAHRKFVLTLGEKRREWITTSCTDYTKLLNEIFDQAEEWGPKKAAPVCNTRRISARKGYSASKHRGSWRRR